MKFIRWFFPLMIIIVAAILLWVYMGMPKPIFKHTATPNPIQIQMEKVSQQQTQLAARLDQMQMQIDQNMKIFTMPEAYYYLNIAQLHLSVFHDVNTALQLMQWVQQRFIITHAPMALQESLSADIGALQTVAVPDINQMIQTLKGVELQISTLPIRKKQENSQQTPNATTTSSSWQQSLLNTWNELKGLIRIQPRNTSMDYVLFDETILRETVQVELERASIAAIIGKTDLYQASLEQAILALQRFFAADDPNVLQAINNLQNLANQVLVPQIPDASRALTWLQTQTAQGMPQ